MRFFVFIVLMLINIGDLNGFNMPCPFSSSVVMNHVKKPGCAATGLDIVSSEQVVTSVNNQNEKNFNGSTFKVVALYNGIVNFIPQKLGDFFKDLEGIRITSSGLKEVKKQDFAQFPNLMECSLYNNEIEVIPAGLFDGNLELEFVFFGSNKLIYVAPNVFTPLKKLETANFESNICVNTAITAQSSVPSLEASFKETCQSVMIETLLVKVDEMLQFKTDVEEKLQFKTDQYDEMLQLKTDVEEKLRSKTDQYDETLRLKTDVEEELRSKTDQYDETLRLKTDVEEECWSTTDQYDETLRLKTEVEEELQLKTVQYDEIYHHLEVESQKMNSCNQMVNVATNLLFALTVNRTDKYSEIPRDDVTMKCKMDSTNKTCAASGFYVRFPDSNLTTIVDEADRAINQSSVEKLLIIDQQTLFLPKNLGSSFPHLKELTIINSGYFHMDKDLLTDMPKLTKLIINENKIRELPERNKIDNNNLDELKLAFNQIELIADSAFANLSKLRVLNLTANLLTTIRAEVFEPLKSLQILILQQNQMKEVSSALFHNLTSLTHLDISYNQIKKISGDIIAPRNKILEFRAGSNEIEMIDQKLLKRLKKSQIIDLTQNLCINDTYNKNSVGGITLEAMHSKIFLRCSDDDY